MNILTTLIGATAIAMSPIQDIPTEVPKNELPKLASCLVCKDEHGQEKPAGGVRYKGKTFYFCNSKEIADFKRDPEAFMPPVLPRPAPAFALTDQIGKVWNAESMAGKTVLIDWWATWCKPCIEMFPKLDQLQAKHAAKGFEILSVSIDEKPESLTKFLAKRTFPNPVLHDTKQTWDAWGVRAIPAMYLVRDGQIVGQWTGKVDAKLLEAAIIANLPNKL